MQYVLGNMLNGGGGLNPDGLSLDLQFALDKTLTARKGPTPVFTRGSTGTFVGSDGLIQSAAINTPRFDHTSAGVCRGLLIEESRTNLFARSAEFDNGYWTKSDLSISADNEISPDGGMNADTITAVIQSPSIYRPVACVASTVYTFSFYVKLGTLTAAAYRFAVRDDTNGVFIDGSITPNITPVTTEWRRVTYTFTTPVGCILVRPYLIRAGAATSGSFYLWGAQMEAGSFATSYIPTVASSVVRSADVCSITGADFSGMFNANDGTLFSNCSVDNTTGTNRGIASIRSGATFFMRQSLGNGFVRSEIRASDTNTILGSTSVSILTAIKMALAYSGNDFASSTNGASPSLVTRTLPTGLSEFRIGSLDGALCLNGHFVAIRYYRKRLPNAKLAQLTV